MIYHKYRGLDFVLIENQKISIISVIGNNVCLDLIGFDPHIVRTFDLFVLTNEIISEGDLYVTDYTKIASYHKAEDKRTADIANDFKAKKIIASLDTDIEFIELPFVISHNLLIGFINNINSNNILEKNKFINY